MSVFMTDQIQTFRSYLSGRLRISRLCDIFYGHSWASDFGRHLIPSSPGHNFFREVQSLLSKSSILHGGMAAARPKKYPSYGHLPVLWIIKGSGSYSTQIENILSCTLAHQLQRWNLHTTKVGEVGLDLRWLEAGNESMIIKAPSCCAMVKHGFYGPT